DRAAVDNELRVRPADRLLEVLHLRLAVPHRGEDPLEVRVVLVDAGDGTDRERSWVDDLSTVALGDERAGARVEPTVSDGRSVLHDDRPMPPEPFCLGRNQLQSPKEDLR